MGPAAFVRSIGLGFLGSDRFAGKTAAYEGWISLDFLGFSRANPELSIGYEAQTAEDFLSAPFP
jgi:hypothetical protein